MTPGEIPESVTARDAAVETPVPPTTAVLTHKIADLIIEMKGHDLVVLDVEDVTTLAEFMIVASGRSSRQVRAVADEIVRFAKQQGIRHLSLEGMDQGWWVLIDFAGVIVHLMDDEARSFYDLEAFWGDGEVIRRGVDGAA